MAINIQANPWIATAAGVLWGKGNTVFVEHMEFEDYANDTDEVIVADANGRVVWTANGAADLQEVRSGKIGAIQNGLQVISINGGGTLKVYIK